MEFQIKSFLELNLIIDAALLLVFCFTVLLRSPKFLIFLVILNLCQYVIWVPDAEILKAHEKLQAEHREALQRKKKAEPSSSSQRAGSLPESLRESLTSGDAVQSTLQSVQLYDQVLQGLGAGPGAATASMQVSLDAWKKTAEENEEKHKKGISLDVFSVFMQMGTDPHAAWFVTRLFWLAATFYLYIQRPQIGVVVFSLNLLPLPFLSRFVPYLWYRFNQQQWVQDLNTWAEVGTFPKEIIEPFVYYSVVLVVLALPLFLIGLAALSQWRKKKETGLRHYLNPSEYDLLIEGLKTPFSVDGHLLNAGDFHLDVRQLGYDPENPHVWHLKTGTKIVFVPKIQETPSGPLPVSMVHADRSWKSRR